MHWRLVGGRRGGRGFVVRGVVEGFYLFLFLGGEEDLGGREGVREEVEGRCWREKRWDWSGVFLFSYFHERFIYFCFFYYKYEYY